MAGSFDAKVDISTADAVRNLRELKKEVQENGAQMRDFNKAIQESKQNVVLAAQQMTKLAQARRQNATATKEETSNTIAAARATAIKTQADAKAAEMLARKSNQEAQASRAMAQGAAAEARKTAIQERSARAASNAADSNKVLTDGLSNTRYLMYDVGATLGVLSGALLALPAASAAVAASYQKDFAQVLRVTEDLTNGGLELRNSLKDIARDIPVGFGELSRITQLGAQMGIAESQLASFTETTAKFVAVTGISADSASQLFGRLESSFNPDQSIPDFFNKVGSAIAKVGAETVATDPEIASMMNQIGSLGASVGMTADQTIGFAAALASVRVQPELARGTLTRVFGDLNRYVADGAPELDAYGKLIGMTADQAGKLWQTDPSQFFNKVIEGLNGLDSAQKTAAFDAIGVKASRDVSALTKLAVGYDTLKISMDAAGDGFSNGTALDKMSEPVFDTVIAKIQKLANSWANLADSIGGVGLAPIGAFIDLLAGFANGLDSIIEAAPGVGVTISILMGLVAVTGVLMGMKAAQAFVLAGLISFQQAMGSKGVTSAMSFSGVLKEVGRTFQLLAGQAGTATVAINGQAAAATAATAANGRLATSSTGVAAALGGKALTGAKAFGSGLLAMAGGPIGIAIIALASLAGAFINSAAEAQDAGKAIATAMKEGAEQGIAEAANRLNNRKVGLLDGALGFSDLDKNVTEIAARAGVAFDKVIAGVAKGADGMRDFNAEMEKIARADGYKNLEDALSNPLPGTKAADLQYLKRVVDQFAGASKDAKVDTEQVDSAVAKLGGTVGDTGEDFSEATDPIEDMEKALKALNDTIFGTLNAEAGLQSALQKIGEGLAESSDFSPNTEGGRTNIDNTQAALQSAQQYYKQLMVEGTLSAQQSAESYAQFVDQLIAQIRATGGDPTPIIQLANMTKGSFQAALNTGSPARVPVEADQAQAARVAITTKDAIQTVLNNTEAKAKVGADVSNADLQLSDLANSLAVLTGLPYSVVLDALTDPAHEKSKQVYDVLTQITGNTYTAPVNADTTAAIANVQNFLAYARTELAHLQSELNGSGGTPIGYADGEGSMGTEQKAQYAALGGAPVQAAPSVAAPPPIQAAPTFTMPDFGGMRDGYNDVADAAKDAGEKGKKAAEDMADGIDDATRAAEDYAQRLRTSLQSAFDKQYGMATAADAYHTALNAISKKNEEQLAQLTDMRDRIKELNNERNKDLIDANKAKIEQGISTKYGETDRAMDYGNQAQTALDNAAAKQKDIDATKKQSAELQAGIGNYKGNTQAAIDNRAAVRDLETKMLDMISAYAATGKSQEQVRIYAQKLTGQFQKDVTQITGKTGNRIAIQGLIGDMGRYVGAVNAVPRVKPTTVSADTGGANNAINGVKNNLASIPRNTTSRVTVEKVTKNWVTGGVVNTGSVMKDGSPIYRVVNPDGTGTNMRIYNRGGMVQGFANGGLIPGTPPSNPREDNLMAQVDGKGAIMVRSREYIQPQEAVDYYGEDFMNAIRTLSLPKFNGGGSVGGGGGFSGSGGGVPVVGLDAETIAALNRLPDIIMYADSIQLAKSVAQGNTILATQGAN